MFVIGYVASDIGKPDTITEEMDDQPFINLHANHPSMTFKFDVLTPVIVRCKKKKKNKAKIQAGTDIIPPS